MKTKSLCILVEIISYVQDTYTCKNSSRPPAFIFSTETPLGTSGHDREKKLPTKCRICRLTNSIIASAAKPICRGDIHANTTSIPIFFVVLVPESTLNIEI